MDNGGRHVSSSVSRNLNARLLTRINSLVSFNEIINAMPSNKVLKQLAGKKRDGEEWQEEYDQALGELLKHRFFRVVLDEGHAIRNNYTKSLPNLHPHPTRSMLIHQS